MAKGSKRVDGIGLALLLTGASWLVRRGTESGWEMVTDRPAPKDQSNMEVDFKEAATWALVSGAVVGIARLAIRRGIARRGPLFTREQS